MKISKILFGILIGAIVFIGLPLFLDWFIVGNKISSNISNSEWIGFLGSYLGGVLGAGATIFGVVLVNNFQNIEEVKGLKKYLEDIFKQNSINKETILIDFFEDLKAEKNTVKKISYKIYEENLLKIYKLKNHKKIFDIYTIQEKLDKQFDNLKPHIIDNGGYLSFLEIRNLLDLAKEHNEDELIRELNELEKMLQIINLCLFQKRESQKIQEEHLIKKFPYTKSIINAFKEIELEIVHNELFRILLNKVATIQVESNYINSNLHSELMMVTGNTFQYFNTLLQHLKKCDEYQTNKN